MKQLIGIDFGTDSVRAVLVTQEGEERAICEFKYPRWAAGKYCDSSISQFRQHPLDYLEGLEHVMKGVLEGQDRASVVGIGVDTTASTPCAVDRDGQPLALRPEFADDPDAMFVLWKDHTGEDEAIRINEVAHNWTKGPDYTMYEGGIYSSEFFWSKALHVLRHNERMRPYVWKFVEHCDWMTSLLTGKPVQAARSTAGHKAMWHPDWNGLPPEKFFCAVDPLFAGIRDRMYSDTFTSDVPVGTLAPEWAAKFGLSTDVVVATGIIDAHSGAVGAGIGDGVDVKILGTSTCDIIGVAKLDRCIPGVCGQVYGSSMPGIDTIEAGQSAFGDAYAWFRKFLGYAGDVSLVRLEEEAAVLPDDSVYAVDWFNGRRTPVADYSLRGAILGLSLGTTPPMVYRALVLATAFGSRAIQEHLEVQGVRMNRVLACGGIAKKSPFVMQTLADVLQKEISVVRSTQTCALGAAISAATAAKLYSSAAEAARHIASPVEKTYYPQKNYDAQYQRYKNAAAFIESQPR